MEAPLQLTANALQPRLVFCVQRMVHGGLRDQEAT